MSDCADNLTRFCRLAGQEPCLFLLSGGCLEILDRSGFTFIDLLLDLALGGFGLGLCFRDHENGEKAEHQQ